MKTLRIFQTILFLGLSACSGLKTNSSKQAFGGGFPNNTNPQTSAQSEYAKKNSETVEIVQTDNSKVLDQQLEKTHPKLVKKKSPIPILLRPLRPYQTYTDSTVKAQRNGDEPVESNSLIGFIFAMCALLFFPLAIPGLVLGIVGLGEYNKNPELYNSTSKGMAKTAIIVSAVLLFLVILYLVFVFALLMVW